MDEPVDVVDRGQIVIVEDEDESRKAMVRALEKKGLPVTSFDNGMDAIRYIRGHAGDIDLVVTDIRMPKVDGLAVLKATKEIDKDLNILLVTGFASVESAVQAMRLGADDYLTKPIDLFEFRARVGKLLKNVSLSREVHRLRSRLDEKFGFEQLVGTSDVMRRLFDKIRAVAPTKANVLIMGESGTGKELIANAIHQNSSVRERRFLPMNCAAIPSEILESELFGHEKGAFTGAESRKLGKFELARDGTMFLDEIGDMSLKLQVKLLRVLENREFTRVGGAEEIKIDTRFVFATNKDLEYEVDHQRFREDLFYRINVICLEVPPLRYRRDDIPVLIRHFLDIFSEKYQMPTPRIDRDVLDCLNAYNWPGNVRELRNLIENLVIFSDGGAISKTQLPRRVASPAYPVKRVEIPNGMTLSELEYEAVIQTLEAVHGNKNKAAEVLGIGVRTLQRKLRDIESAAEPPVVGDEKDSVEDEDENH